MMNSELQVERQSARPFFANAGSMTSSGGEPAPRLGKCLSSAKCASGPRRKGGLAPWQIQRVTRYINEQLHTKLSTKVLAAQVHLSEFHFCRAFRLSVGESPHSYVTSCRIEAAKRLLTSTSRPIGDIALECGAADQAHFTNLFRRCAGQTPGSWRRNGCDEYRISHAR